MGDNFHCCNYLRLKEKAHLQASQPPFLGLMDFRGARAVPFRRNVVSQVRAVVGAMDCSYHRLPWPARYGRRHGPRARVTHYWGAPHLAALPEKITSTQP